MVYICTKEKSRTSRTCPTLFKAYYFIDTAIIAERFHYDNRKTPIRLLSCEADV